MICCPRHYFAGQSTPFIQPWFQRLPQGCFDGEQNYRRGLGCALVRAWRLRRSPRARRDLAPLLCSLGTDGGGALRPATPPGAAYHNPAERIQSVVHRREATVRRCSTSRVRRAGSAPSVTAQVAQRRRAIVSPCAEPPSTLRRRARQRPPRRGQSSGRRDQAGPTFCGGWRNRFETIVIVFGNIQA